MDTPDAAALVLSRLLSLKQARRTVALFVWLRVCWCVRFTRPPASPPPDLSLKHQFADWLPWLSLGAAELRLASLMQHATSLFRDIVGSCSTFARRTLDCIVVRGSTSCVSC